MGAGGLRPRAGAEARAYLGRAQWTKFGRIIMVSR
jgi:hypothetical protein